MPKKDQHDWKYLSVNEFKWKAAEEDLENTPQISNWIGNSKEFRMMTHPIQSGRKFEWK